MDAQALATAVWRQKFQNESDAHTLAEVNFNMEKTRADELQKELDKWKESKPKVLREFEAPPEATE